MDTTSSSLYCVWGTSASNVYAVGDNNVYGEPLMFHFDGSGWIGVDLPSYVSVLFKVYGFDSQNIYAIGAEFFDNPNKPPNVLDSTLIMHFNGLAWSRETTPPGRSLSTIWGHSPNDIWAGGSGGTLLHFDGQVWNKKPMDSLLNFGGMAGFSSDDIYVLAAQYDEAYDILFHYDGLTWQPIDSASMASLDPHFGIYRLAVVGQTLYSLGNRLFSYQNGSWQPEADIGYVSPLQCLFAVSTTNAMLVGDQSQVYHYDGQSWIPLDFISGPNWLIGVWATENEAFIVGSSSTGVGSVILHGK